MKTIKLMVATAVMALCSVSAFAQTEAGKMMVGAGTSLSLFSGKPSMKVEGNKGTDTKATTNLKLAFDARYFVIDNLAVGAGLGYDFTGRDGESQGTFVIAPAVSYFFLPNSNIRPFLSAEVGYAHQSSSDKDKDTKTTTSIGGLHYGVGGGVAYFVNPNVGLTLGLGYTSSSFKKDKVTTTLAGISSTLGLTFVF
ncbi:MAG: outer membrane beta-barrel protein [Porphyromonas somerae]|uniref:outer membrane beta-barrel protein n=1 Tax=Porphyromonas somerae TaxID=322095 RepID=UPI0026F1C3F2|nr:outer membrane beta-barrel protein [Porphyromonas somerae]MDD7558435.1 outer membrane beta-barrel protein [Porphyromonas somerae]MDY5816120.1 outer membrane beta-barrel protein [Porphyromonas somerae]